MFGCLNVNYILSCLWIIPKLSIYESSLLFEVCISVQIKLDSFCQKLYLIGSIPLRINTNYCCGLIFCILSPKRKNLMHDLTGPMKKVYFFHNKSKQQIAVVKKVVNTNLQCCKICVKEFAIADSEHGLVNNWTEILIE